MQIRTAHDKKRPHVQCLEDKFQCQLELTSRVGAGDGTVGCICGDGVGCLIVDVIENVEGLGAKLERLVFADEGKALVQGQVHIDVTRGTNGIAGQVAKGLAGDGNRRGGGIEIAVQRARGLDAGACRGQQRLPCNGIGTIDDEVRDIGRCGMAGRLSLA
jgi:hypothetical protein